MKAIDALKEALNSSGIPVTHIGLKLGRRPNYVSGIATRGSTPQADMLASMHKCMRLRLGCAACRSSARVCSDD